MNFKNLLPVALAGLIGISAPACKPLAEKKKAEVERILDVVQPTEDLVKSSQQYYQNREDLKSISLEERASLALGHAKLTRVQEGLKDGTLSFQDFYNTIVQSDERVITDEHTKLQIENSLGNFSSGSVNKKSIELWTTPGNPNMILEDYSVSDVKMQGGELAVTVSGNIYETVVTDQAVKQQLDANLSPRNGKTPGTWTLKLRLMLKK